MAEETPGPSTSPLVAHVVGRRAVPVAVTDPRTGQTTGSVVGPVDESKVWATDHHDGRGPVAARPLADANHIEDVPLTAGALVNPQATE
jgi:hypothetical protein